MKTVPYSWQPAFIASEQAQKTKTSKQDGKWQKIQGCTRLKQVKRQRNLVDKYKSMKE